MAVATQEGFRLSSVVNGRSPWRVRMAVATQEGFRHLVLGQRESGCLRSEWPSSFKRYLDYLRLCRMCFRRESEWPSPPKRDLDAESPLRGRHAIQSEWPSPPKRD